MQDAIINLLIFCLIMDIFKLSVDYRIIFFMEGDKFEESQRRPADPPDTENVKRKPGGTDVAESV